MVKVYALYKGEECLGIGTLKELAKELKVQYETMKFYTTPTYKGKNRRVLVRVE